MTAGASEQAGLTQRLVPAAAFQFSFVAAITLLKSAANALVLARYQSGALPFLYLSAAGITALLTGFLKARQPTPRALAIAGGGTAVMLGAALHWGFSPASLCLYVFAEVFATYLSIAFWTNLGAEFNAREARRAFTLVSGIGMGGGIAGGLIAQELAKRLGAETLLIAGAIALAAGALALKGSVVGAQQRRPRTSRRAVWRYVHSHRYGQALAALVLLFSALSVFADFLFRHRAAGVLSENEMAALFGNVQLWMGLFCVVFQLLFAEPLLRKLGILRYLALVPLLLAPLAGISLVERGLWPAYLLKLVESAASLSILPVAMQLLYAPLPDNLRDGVRSAMDGLVKKSGLALGAVLLLGWASHTRGPELGLGVLAMCGVALFALLKMRPVYLLALKEQVEGETTGPLLSSAITDAQVLAEQLHSPVPEKVLQALELMESARLDLRPYLSALLQHSHERVQQRAVQLAVELRVVEAVPALEALLQSPHRRPRDEAVRALAELAPDRAVAHVKSLLLSSDVGLRCAAIGALATLKETPLVEEGLAQLAEHRSAAPAAERREVARLLGRLADERWSRLLATYLDDGDASVRRIAVTSVGAGRYLSLAPRLLQFLTWRDERKFAREALVELSDEATPLLAATLNDRTRPAALRYTLPRVLRHIGTQQALEALLFSNVRDDAFLHYRIGVALARIHAQHPELKVDRHWVLEALGRRRDVYRTLAQPFADLSLALGDESLFTRSVGDRLDQAFELSFWLLGLLHDPKAMRRIHAHLVGQDHRRRAYALELLENTLAPAEWMLIRDQTEHSPRQLKGDASRLAEHLSFLCHADDSVLRACARQVARQKGLWAKAVRDDDLDAEWVARLFALEGVHVFAQCDVDDVAAAAAVAKQQTFRAGAVIYNEGAAGDALFVIVKGRVEAHRAGQPVITFVAKQAFGELSLLDGSPRPTDVVASEETTVLVIDRRDFTDLISDRPEFLKGVFRALSEQLLALDPA